MSAAYYFFTALSYIAICCVALYTFFSWRKSGSEENTSRYIGVIGLMMFVPSMMNALWAFSLLEPSVQDAFLINGLFSILLAPLMLVVIYRLTRNRNLLYLLALFAISLVSLPYSFSKFFVSLLIAANLLFLIISLEVLIIKRYHIQFAGGIGALYSITAVTFSVLLLFGAEYSEIWWFIPNMMLAAMLFMLHLDIKYYSILSPKEPAEKKPRAKKVFMGLIFARYLLYVISVASITMIATVSLHELGHALTASYYGCEPTRIIYDLHNPPYTEIGCSSLGSSAIIITLAGIIFVFIAAMLFYATEGVFTTRLAELMIGFGFLIAYTDLQDLGISESIILLIMVLSVFIVIAAIVNFSLFYISEHLDSMQSAARGAGSHPIKNGNRRRSRQLV
ncbi:hypothetical protein JXB11_03015 [Candidatus Woesearchaeota archaeon]|nr:hypothetical protein [Candidatus Woesearchaeota archaeon]